MFIWEKKIKSSDKRWLIKYSDWTEEKYSPELAEALVSKDKKDLDAYTTYKVHTVVDWIIQFLIWANLSIAELNRTLSTLQQTLEHKKDEAMSKLFNVENPIDINLTEIQNIILKSHKDKWDKKTK